MDDLKVLRAPSEAATNKSSIHRFLDSGEQFLSFHDLLRCFL